jgi:hypothetical protein
VGSGEAVQKKAVSKILLPGPDKRKPPGRAAKPKSSVPGIVLISGFHPKPAPGVGFVAVDFILPPAMLL